MSASVRCRVTPSANPTYSVKWPCSRGLPRLTRAPVEHLGIRGTVAARVAEQCDRMGFAGAPWPVYPERVMMGGRFA